MVKNMKQARNRLRVGQTPIRSFAMAPNELDTYTPVERDEKERTLPTELQKHWELRAERRGIQSVMSARHTPQENIEATKRLQQEIFDFLSGLVEAKRVFELGVGIGRMTGVLANKSSEVVGCDFSGRMIRRARWALRGMENVSLHQGKITEIELGLPPKYFDLVFESIVLLHILSPKELADTARCMQELSDRIFLVEHTYEGPDFPISRYSILRTPDEYVRLFEPYRLVKQREHLCAGDKFTLMLFEI